MGGRYTSAALPFSLSPDRLGYRSYAASFGDSLTDAVIVPPAVPKLTLNCVHGPKLVERTPWIW